MSNIVPLWPDNHSLDVVGVTGEFGTGKTLFCLSIARPDRTLIFDLEMSSKDCPEFEKRGLTRIDIPAEMHREFKGKPYSQKQLFLWWLKYIQTIEDGRYDNIILDPANEFEAGLVEWVASRYSEFDYKSRDKFRSMGGVFHSAVKDEWKRIKLMLAQKCQTFSFANHMRGVWVDGESTGDREAKGKDSFFALSSLYLHLDMESDADAPSAVVLKTRMKRTFFDEETGLVKKIVPVLRKGQRIPVATPEAIREYIKDPVGDRELRPEEIVKEKVLTDDEKLQLQAKKAHDERLAAEAAKEVVKEQTEIEKLKTEREENARARAREALKPTSKPEVKTKPSPQKAEADLLKAVKNLLDNAEAKGVKERLVKGIQKDLGIKATGELTRGDAKKVTPEILKKYTEGLSKVTAKTK